MLRGNPIQLFEVSHPPPQPSLESVPLATKLCRIPHYNTFFSLRVVVVSHLVRVVTSLVVQNYRGFHHPAARCTCLPESINGTAPALLREMDIWFKNGCSVMSGVRRVMYL